MSASTLRKTLSAAVACVAALAVCVAPLIAPSVARGQPPELGSPLGTSPAPEFKAAPPSTDAQQLSDKQVDGDAALPQRRRAVSEELRIAKRALQDAQGGEEKPPERLSHELELLKQIETVLAQIVGAKTAEEELRAKKRAMQAAVEAPATPEDLSFIEMDNLKDELATKQGRIELVESSVTTANDALAASLPETC